MDYIVAVKGKDDGLVGRLLQGGRKKVYEDSLFCVIKVERNHG